MRNWTRALRSTIAMLAGGAAGCSWSNTVGTETVRACSGTVQPTVSAETTPRFSWSPPCGFRELRVETTAAGAFQPGVVWSLTARGRLVESGVTYGVVPDGNDPFLLPTPLRAGVTYQLVLVPLVTGQAETRTSWVQR